MFLQLHTCTHTIQNKTLGRFSQQLITVVDNLCMHLENRITGDGLTRLALWHALSVCHTQKEWKGLTIFLPLRSDIEDAQAGVQLCFYFQ